MSDAVEVSDKLLFIVYLISEFIAKYDYTIFQESRTILLINWRSRDSNKNLMTVPEQSNKSFI